MKIVLKQNVINIVAMAISLVLTPGFIILVWVTDATLGERIMITLMMSAMIVGEILELFKAIFWRVIVEDDEFTFRNRWGKESSYSYNDVCAIRYKRSYYVVILADQRIAVEYRAVDNCDYFVDVAARNGVKIEART